MTGGCPRITPQPFATFLKMAQPASSTLQNHYSLLVAHIQHLDECLSKLSKFDARVPELRKMRSRAVKAAQDAKRAESLMSADNIEILYFDVSEPAASSEDERNAQPPLVRTTPPPVLSKRTYEEYDELRSGTPPGKRRRVNEQSSSQQSATFYSSDLHFGLHDIPEENWPPHHEQIPQPENQGDSGRTEGHRGSQKQVDPSTLRQTDAGNDRNRKDFEQKNKRKHAGGLENTSPAESGQKRLRSSVPV